MKKIYNINIIITLQIIFFSISIFSNYFQYPFESVSVFVVPCLAVYLLLTLTRSNFLNNINHEFVLLISISYMYMAYILFVSGFNLIPINRTIRFFLIFAMLPLFFLIDHDNAYIYFYKSFIIFGVLRSIIQLLLLIFIADLFGIPLLVIEELLSIEHGMIYHDGYSFHIILPGTAFLPLAFMLRFTRTLKFDIPNIILLAGILIAGNFAYLLGLFCFIIYCIFVRFIRSKKYWYVNITSFFFLLLVLVVLLLPYVTYQYELKKTFSNAVRLDQTKVLLTTGNVISGNGFGKSIDISTDYRDYSGAMYFELQTFYIINQIGFIGYCVFMFCTIYIFHKRNREMLPIYIIYLLYSFWNPYCYDTGHMVTVMLFIGNNKFFGVTYEPGYSI